MNPIDHTHNPDAKSWIEISKDSDFPIQNLPFGIFSTPEGPRRVGIAIGEYILDLYQLEIQGYIKPSNTYLDPELNRLMSQGRDFLRELRIEIFDLLVQGETKLKNDSGLEKILLKQSEVALHVPFKIGTFVDFYSSEYHASSVGRIFRPHQNPLFFNWKYLPVAYQGRSSSIVISGKPIYRPWGQVKPKGQQPMIAPTQEMDFELEVGFFTCKKI